MKVKLNFMCEFFQRIVKLIKIHALYRYTKLFFWRLVLNFSRIEGKLVNETIE